MFLNTKEEENSSAKKKNTIQAFWSYFKA